MSKDFEAVENQLFRAFTTPSPFDAIIDRNPLPPNPEFAEQIIAGFTLRALIAARESRTAQAISYREFYVGCAMVAYSTEQNKIGIFTGLNVKVEEDGEVNIHGEDVAMAKAMKNGFDRIPVIAVVAEPQVDDHSGQPSKTLHPCVRCRTRFEESSLIGERSLILSSVPDISVIEAYTTEGLKQLHDHGDSSGITLLEPGPEAINWDNVVNPFLGQFIMQNLATK